MRYSQDHKAQTHERIIKEAAARFRRDGIGATGLQPLMKALGLTHGGFYSHFASKDELVEKALQAAGTELVKSEPKKCELSEKSIRTCIDTPSTIPFLILLFLLPLLPRASRVITLLPIQGYQAKPRRIHLTHCRFQE